LKQAQNKKARRDKKEGGSVDFLKCFFLRVKNLHSFVQELIRGNPLIDPVRVMVKRGGLPVKMKKSFSKNKMNWSPCLLRDKARTRPNQRQGTDTNLSRGSKRMTCRSYWQISLPTGGSVKHTLEEKRGEILTTRETYELQY